MLSKRYVLVTGHRRENFAEGFDNICKALSELATANPVTHFIYPMHRFFGDASNVYLIKPLGYEPFVYLLQHSHLLLTVRGVVTGRSARLR